MKFTISSSTFSDHLQILGRVIASKNNMSILENFLLEIIDNKLTITASDNENTVKANIDLIESDGNMRFTVNAKKIQDAIKEIPEQPLEFFYNEQNMDIVVQYQNGQFNLMGQNAEEFPEAPQLGNLKGTVRVPSSLLQSAVIRASLATADDALRPVMNGIYFDAKEDYLSVVASDGHKLACDKLLNIKTPNAINFILPKKPSAILKSILSKVEEDVSLEVYEQNAQICIGNYTMLCRLIEGRYPNYNSVIPKDNPNHVTLNRDALIAALRRVLIFSNAVSSLVKIQVGGSKMTISSQDTDFSMYAEESLLCEYTGNPINIGFKGPFLLELITNIQDEEIILELADASRAGVIVPAKQPENEEVLMILMPMMLNE